MADAEALRTELRELGERLRAAQDADAETHSQIARLLPAALDAGLSKREIARLSGASRPWMDKVLRDRV
jgi:hypothetical protein